MAVVEHRWRAMASEALAIVVGDGPAVVSAVDHVVVLVDHLESCWSRFLPTSDVTRLNLAGGNPIVVDPSTLTLLATMQAAARHTGDAFDATILPDLVAAGYVASIDGSGHVTVVPTHVDRNRRLGEVELDAATDVARLPAGLTVDPGGIGKGLAADLAVDAALALGADGVLVSIGGDLSMAGRAPDPDGWRVTVEHPDLARPALGDIVVEHGGVATSTTRSRRWQHDGEWHHHVIDPSTGRPATTDLASVTVVAGNGWLAEAHATAALLAGAHDVLAYLADHDVSGIAVTDDGDVLTTADLAGLERVS